MKTRGKKSMLHVLAMKVDILEFLYLGHLAVSLYQEYKLYPMAGEQDPITVLLRTIHTRRVRSNR